VLAERRGERVTLYGRSGQDTTSRYPEIVRALESLAIDRFVIDGEIVALDESGRPSFQRLQPRMGLTDPRDVALAAQRRPAAGVFFDCLQLDDRDLRRQPLLDRKECLRWLVPALGTVRYGDHVVGEGVAFYEAASAQRLEGIVAKKARGPYPAGRTRDWIKIKCQRAQAFVIGGYTDPQGARGHFGALNLGVYDGPPDASRLVYVSKVGTGFDEAGLAAIRERLRPLARATAPFEAGAIPRGRGHHWVEPRLVCEVRFTEWTEDGGLRQPSFVRLLDDHDPRACRRKGAEPVDATAVDAAPAGEETHRDTESPTGPVAAPASPSAARVQPTNLRKVFWPAEGYTKADLLDYYERIAPWMLPYLRDRPLVLTRFPDGIAGKSFYQKDAPEFAPAWVRTERIYSRDTERDIAYLVVDDVEMLRYVANSAAIPIHCWASRVPSLERPDWLVLDLDPRARRSPTW
jgi:bifunctional non-homologous end joining protein LigD